jgi:hypothetical protein
MGKVQIGLLIWFSVASMQISLDSNSTVRLAICTKSFIGSLQSMLCSDACVM